MLYNGCESGVPVHGPARMYYHHTQRYIIIAMKIITPVRSNSNEIENKAKLIDTKSSSGIRNFKSYRLN